MQREVDQQESNAGEGVAPEAATPEAPVSGGASAEAPVLGGAPAPAATPAKPARAVRKQATWKVALSFVAVIILTPATMVLGDLFAQDNYYITSILIVIYAMIPFFTAFESRRPQARELVVLAVLCALAVVSRAAFIWLPSFKPMLGIIMIAGIAFGAQVGFLTGSISAFVSNFIFGQGPWTPWQMFAFGLAGFIMGFLADRGIIPRCSLGGKVKTAVAIGGFALIVLVIGPILDTNTLFTVLALDTPVAAAAVYASGLPFNVIHGTCVAVTILVLANPLLDKLARVKTKYGMME